MSVGKRAVRFFLSPRAINYSWRDLVGARVRMRYAKNLCFALSIFDGRRRNTPVSFGIGRVRVPYIKYGRGNSVVETFSAIGRRRRRRRRFRYFVIVVRTCCALPLGRPTSFSPLESVTCNSKN